MSYKKLNTSKNQMTWYYITQKTRYFKLSNKIIIAVSLILCLATGLVLLSLHTISSTNHLQTAQAENSLFYNMPSLVPVKLHLQLEQLRLYLEQSLKDRHPGWIAGSAKQAYDVPM